MGIFVFGLLLAVALLRLGAALVWLHVLSSAVLASVLVIAVLGAALGWQAWRRRR